jgi:hypothetical protein
LQEEKDVTDDRRYVLEACLWNDLGGFVEVNKIRRAGQAKCPKSQPSPLQILPNANDIKFDPHGKEFAVFGPSAHGVGDTGQGVNSCACRCIAKIASSQHPAEKNCPHTPQSTHDNN